MSLSDEIRNIGKRCESKGTCGFPNEMGITCADFPSCGNCISGALGKLADKVYLIEHERSEDRETAELVREKEYLMDRYDESLSAASYRAERDAALQDVERMRPAYEWVRERGGLEEVKRAMQDSDNRRVELCSALGIDTVTGWSDAVAEMEKRLMPPGMEWPRFEDGEKVCFGKRSVDNSGDWFDIVSLKFTCDWWSVSGYHPDRNGTIGTNYRRSIEGLSYETRIKRPKPDPIGADGLPVLEGDEVWHNGREFGPRIVKSIYYRNGKAFADFEPNDTCVLGCECDQLTHTKPEPTDSWEKLETDASMTSCEYFGSDLMSCHKCIGMGPDICQKRKCEDIVRRAKALAEQDGSSQ